MVESQNIIRLKEMLTLVCPNPDGTIGIAGDKLKRVMIDMGFEFMVMNDAGVTEVREALDSGARGFVPINDFASYLDEYVAECTNE